MFTNASNECVVQTRTLQERLTQLTKDLKRKFVTRYKRVTHAFTVRPKNAEKLRVLDLAKIVADFLPKFRQRQ